MGYQPPEEMVAQLMVIDYQSDDLAPVISEWKRNTLAPFAQNCQRNLYYGFAEDFADFPYEHLHRSNTQLAGQDAYVHILKFASGFERGAYQSHNRHQFFEAWATSVKNNWETGEKYGRLLSLIESDTNFMYKHITSHYKTPRFEIAVRDLSDMTKGDDILIVGALDRKDGLSPFTSGMIRTAESKQKKRKSFIGVTHPDPETLEKLKEAVKFHEEKGNMRSGVHFVDFEDIATAFELNNKVYITMPMNSEPEAEAQIIDAWRNRASDTGKLTHLHTDPNTAGEMSDLWANADLDNFVSPHDLRDDMAHRAQHNNNVIVSAEKGFWLCSVLRSEGLPIMKEDFFGRVSELDIE